MYVLSISECTFRFDPTSHTCGEGSEMEQYAGSYAPIVWVGGGWEVWEPWWWWEGSLSWKFAAWIRLVACSNLVTDQGNRLFYDAEIQTF